MERSPNSELSRRINYAFSLLKEGISHSQILIRLSHMFGISKVQAYRYLQQAKQQKESIPIVEDTVVFTVKLTPTLIKRIRIFARSSGTSISKVVKTALEEFLAKKGHGEKRETS